jgi:hypothetical protein
MDKTSSLQNSVWAREAVRNMLSRCLRCISAQYALMAREVRP